MWDAKPKAANDHDKPLDTDGGSVGDRGKGGRGEMKVKGVKYWAREGNLTQGGEHIMRHICNLLLNGALKICLVLFIDVTLMIFNNNTNNM